MVHGHIVQVPSAFWVGLQVVVVEAHQVTGLVGSLGLQVVPTVQPLLLPVVVLPGIWSASKTAALKFSVFATLTPNSKVAALSAMSSFLNIFVFVLKDMKKFNPCIMTLLKKYVNMVWGGVSIFYVI